MISPGRRIARVCGDLLEADSGTTKGRTNSQQAMARAGLSPSDTYSSVKRGRMHTVGEDPMTSRKSTLRFSAMFLTVISISITAQEQNGVSKFRDVKAPGAIETDTYAVNNLGVIAGAYVDANHIQHGMILTGTKLTTVDRTGCLTTPGPGAIALFGLATKGAAVGWCQDTTTGRNDAFFYLQGRFVNIVPPGAVSTQAYGINDLNEIVGAYLDAKNVQHGFVLNGKTYTPLDIQGHTFPSAWSINNQGLIAVYALNSKRLVDSFLTTGRGGYKLINVPGAVQSIVHGMNRFGDRIYTTVDSAGAQHGVFYLKGTFYRFNDPNDKHKNTTRGYGLNDKLVIVGDYAAGGLRHPAAAVTQGFLAYGCCR